MIRKSRSKNFESQTTDIRKTCPCNVYPLEPHFYIAKLGYAGVYLFFLFLLQNIDCGYSLEPPRRGGSNVYPQSMFASKNKKNNIHIFLMKCSIFTAEKNLCILHGHVFVMHRAGKKEQNKILRSFTRRARLPALSRTDSHPAKID